MYAAPPACANRDSINYRYLPIQEMCNDELVNYILTEKILANPTGLLTYDGINNASEIIHKWMNGNSYTYNDISKLIAILMLTCDEYRIQSILARFNIESQVFDTHVLIVSYYSRKGIPPPKCKRILIWYLGDESYSTILY